MIETRYLTPNKMTRWCDKRIRPIKGIVFHWAADPGATLLNMWTYFENMHIQHPHDYKRAYTYFIRETIWQVLPDNERDGATGLADFDDYPEKIKRKFPIWPDAHLVNILMLEIDDEGRFMTKTIALARMLAAKLCVDNELDPVEDVYRHYDITKKKCPKWFVDNPDNWEQFRLDIKGIFCRGGGVGGAAMY